MRIFSFQELEQAIRRKLVDFGGLFFVFGDEVFDTEVSGFGVRVQVLVVWGLGVSLSGDKNGEETNGILPKNLYIKYCFNTLYFPLCCVKALIMTY